MAGLPLVRKGDTAMERTIKEEDESKVNAKEGSEKNMMEGVATGLELEDHERARIKAKKAAMNKRKKENAKRNKEGARKEGKENILTAVSISYEPFEIKESPGKGLGVFATTTIPQGTEIFREEAMIRGIDEVNWLGKEASYMVLSDEKKPRFSQLHSRCTCRKIHCEETTFMKTWETNCFKVNGCLSFVFEMASRINHDCVPNTSHSFTEEGKIVFCTEKKIKKGEEITTNYAGGGSTQDRRRLLLNEYGFFCRCEACTNNRPLSIFTQGRHVFDTRGKFANNSGTTLLGERSCDERVKEIEVQEWARNFSATIYVAEMAWKLTFGELIGLDTSTPKTREAHIKVYVTRVDKLVREHNKYRLSEDVISKYVAAEEKVIRQRAESMFQSIMATIADMKAGGRWNL